MSTSLPRSCIPCCCGRLGGRVGRCTACGSACPGKLQSALRSASACEQPCLAALRGRGTTRAEPARGAAGFFFGRTPLIKLSPKKTWEGFFGGLVLTMLCSWLLADVMSRGSWMICPRTARPLASASSGSVTTGRSGPPGRLPGATCDVPAP